MLNGYQAFQIVTFTAEKSRCCVGSARISAERQNGTGSTARSLASCFLSDQRGAFRLTRPNGEAFSQNPLLRVGLIDEISSLLASFRVPAILPPRTEEKPDLPVDHQSVQSIENQVTTLQGASLPNVDFA